MNKIGYAKGQPLKAGSAQATWNASKVPSTQAKLGQKPHSMGKVKTSMPKGMNKVAYSGMK